MHFHRNACNFEQVARLLTFTRSRYAFIGRLMGSHSMQRSCPMIRLFNFPDRGKFLPHIPNRLRGVLRKGLEVDPANRFRSALDFSNAISSVSVSLDWSVTTTPNSRVWSASRTERPTIIVEHDFSSRRHSIRIYSERNSVRRALRKDLWRESIRPSEAETQLKAIFRSLE